MTFHMSCVSLEITSCNILPFLKGKNNGECPIRTWFTKNHQTYSDKRRINYEMSKKLISVCVKFFPEKSKR